MGVFLIVQPRDVVGLEDGVIRLLLRDRWKAKDMGLPQVLLLLKVILRIAAEWSSLAVPGVTIEEEALFEAEAAVAG